MNELKKTIKLLTLALAIMLTGSLLVSAQDGTGGKTSKRDKMNMGSKMMPNASDTEFANMASMGGQAEIQMAQLAMKKSTNKGVQSYAKKMVKDHTKAGMKLDKIAMKKGMTLSKTPNDEQMQMMNQLQQASAADFDKMYIQMSGVDAHQKMQTLFQSEASGGSDAEIKGFAAKTLPTVQMHLKMAQDMASGGMMSGDSMKKGM